MTTIILQDELILRYKGGEVVKYHYYRRGERIYGYIIIPFSMVRGDVKNLIRERRGGVLKYHENCFDGMLTNICYL